ncbi:uncharacterized protein LOC142174426 [Nicotiana tabacum]|uniref:Uncharacterized protein LOC142174426 n=1 Tax=Nicotiana tabacum TaxID=4097 RepID=A0AC58TGH2_TOBAC
MNALFWNVRSVNTMKAFERLVIMQRQHHFQFIGIMELMQRATKLEWYRRKIGMLQVYANVSNKIWVFVDEDHGVDIIINMDQQMTLKITNMDSGRSLIVTFVYAKCDSTERIELWDSLYALARDMDLPWLVGGDFNVIWDEEEKFGGRPVHMNEVFDFRHCVNTCNLFDLGFKGSIYTLWNGQGEDDCIFKRLDRILANAEFQQMFAGLEVIHLSKISSDHCPMMLSVQASTVPIKRSFKFLNFWTKNPTFKNTVAENWTTDFHANPFTLFNHKLKKVKKSLSIWSKATFGNIFEKIASLEEVVLVHEAQFELNPSFQNRERLMKVQAEFIKYLTLEEEFWKQKFGLSWFKDGDRSTKFFHAQVMGRRKRLELKRIQNSEGNWIEDSVAMAEEAVKYFTDQFHEDKVPDAFDILDHVPHMVNNEQNDMLLR